MAKVVGISDRVNRQGLIHLQVLAPVDLLQFLVVASFVSSPKAIDSYQHTKGRTAFKIDPVKHLLISGTIDDTGSGLYITGP